MKNVFAVLPATLITLAVAAQVNVDRQVNVAANAPNSGVVKVTTTTNNVGDQWWIGFGQNGLNTDANDRARIGVNAATGGAGRLFFTTGAAGSQTEKMRIDENGNVGIGTTPSAALDIHNNDETGYMTALIDVATKSALKVRPHNSNSTSFYFGQGNTGNSHVIQAANGPGTTAYDLSFNPFGGKVGVGNIAPTAVLDIHNNTETGYMTALADVTTKSALKIRPHNSNSTSFYFGQGNTGAAHIIQAANGPGTGAFDLSFNPFGGRVGIGTTTPTKALEVLAADGEAVRLYRNANTPVFGVNIRFALNNSSNAEVDYAGVHGQINTNTAGAEGGNLILTTATNGSLTEKMRIDNNGYVGIGNAPTAPLTLVTPGNTADGTYYSSFTIRKTANTFSGIRFDNNATALFRLGTDPSNNFQISRLTGAGAPDDAAFYMNQSGYVGHGTSSPTTFLHLKGQNISYRGQLTLEATDYTQITLYGGATTATHLGTQIYFNVGGQQTVIQGFNGVNLGASSIALNPGGGNVGVGGNNTSYTFNVTGTAHCTSSWQVSDQRYKKDVSNLQSSLDKISQLQGVSYNWKREEFPAMKFDDKKQIGLIAQEVEKVLPEVVMKDDKGYYAINYSEITPVLIEAVKELREQNQQLLLKIQQLESKVR